MLQSIHKQRTILVSDKVRSSQPVMVSKREVECPLMEDVVTNTSPPQHEPIDRTRILIRQLFKIIK